MRSFSHEIRSSLVVRGKLLAIALLSAGCGGDTKNDKTSGEPCEEGAACEVSDPCMRGAISCTSGEAVCVAISVADGQSCGENLSCQAGVCTCTGGAACAAGVCHSGTVSCLDNVPTCIEAPLADGTSCGTNMECIAGACVCAEGESCVIGGCHVGVISCDTGAPACTGTGDFLEDGTSCGANRVCLSGVCSCQSGASCETDACNTGVIVCDGDLPVCATTPVVNGTACGTEHLCLDGDCRSIEDCPNVEGLWNSIEIFVTGISTCSEDLPVHRISTLTQDGCLAIIDDGEHQFEGVVFEERMLWQGSYEHGDGTITVAGEALFNDATASAMLGVQYYLYDEPGYQCFGILDVDAARGKTGVAATLQENCYGEAGVVDCGVNETGQDGALQRGVRWAGERFISPPSLPTGGPLLDLQTGLEWAPSASIDATCSAAETLTFAEAFAYIDCLNDNSYLNYNDWRLPSVSELASLVNLGVENNAIWLEDQGFGGVMTSSYWTSTSHQYHSANYAYTVEFNRGAIQYTDKDSSLYVYVYVWPVRTNADMGSAIPSTSQTASDGLDWPDPRFATAGDLIFDQLTGLTWGRDLSTFIVQGCSDQPPSVTRTFDEALAYVQCLNDISYGGYSDWRLPNRNELSSLVSYGMEGNAGIASLEAQGFSGLSASDYWSSTTVVVSESDPTTNAWVVRMPDGYAFSDTPKSDQSAYVLWVRGGR